MVNKPKKVEISYPINTDIDKMIAEATKLRDTRDSINETFGEVLGCSMHMDITDDYRIFHIILEGSKRGALEKIVRQYFSEVGFPNHVEGLSPAFKRKLEGEYGQKIPEKHPSVIAFLFKRKEYVPVHTYRPSNTTQGGLFNTHLPGDDCRGHYRSSGPPFI